MGSGALGFGAQHLPPVVQVLDGNPREIAGELAEISGGAGGRAHHRRRLTVRQRGEVLLGSQQQCRVIRELDIGVDAQRSRRRHCLVEANGVAQIPEPVLHYWQVRGDAFTQGAAEAGDFAVEERRLLQLLSQARTDLVAELVDDAGVRGIVYADHARERAPFCAGIDEAPHRCAITRNRSHVRRVDHRKLRPAGATGQQRITAVPVGRDDYHGVVAGCEFVGGPRADSHHAHRVGQGHHTADIGGGDLALAVPDGDVRWDSDGAPHRGKPGHMNEQRRLDDAGSVSGRKILVQKIIRG